ncbi:MAG TPA: site-2 protease family protein [Myxococcales bacterium LLY-WYZ-16_1]|jgi:Zn-dependent protease|nr:site-2 protease family protein [Myxococcales bacterium LLY-WYZ-16_1]
MDPNLWGMLPMWLVAFLMSLTFHEAAHAWAAMWGGDRTAHEAGQVTLHPGPHVRREPFGTLVVPILTYFLNGGGWMLGWASAPYDPHWAGRHPKRAAGMAAAGPAANYLLAAVAGGVMFAGLQAGWFALPNGLDTHRLVVGASGSADAITSFLSVTFTLNLVLGTFNLLPVPPLDGHSVVGLFLSDDLARKWSQWGREPMFALVGILVAWKVFPYLWGPVFRTAIQLLYGWI